MNKFLAIFAMAGLAIFGQHSAAWAGGALATTLTQVAGTEDCDNLGNCATSGGGSVATLKVRKVHSLGFVMQGLLPNTGYHVSYKGEGCSRPLTTFTTGATGSADFTVALTTDVPALGDLVEICRDVAPGGDGVEPVYAGALTRLNGRG